jgi:hypothetical protein
MNDKQNQIELAQKKIKWLKFVAIIDSALILMLALFLLNSRAKATTGSSIKPDMQMEWLLYALIGCSLLSLLCAYLLRTYLPAFILNPKGPNQFLPLTFKILKDKQTDFPKVALSFSILLLILILIPINYALLVVIFGLSPAYMIIFVGLTVLGLIFYLRDGELLGRLYDRVEEWRRET